MYRLCWRKSLQTRKRIFTEMDKQRLWVYFSGEVHGINTGWRVTEVEEGRKWVYLKTAGKRRHKVSRKVWDSMGKRKFELTQEEKTTAALKSEVENEQTS